MRLIWYSANSHLGVPLEKALSAHEFMGTLRAAAAGPPRQDENPPTSINEE